MGEQALILAKAYHFQSSKHLIDKILQNYTLSDEQTEAVTHITGGVDMTAIVGRAGTSKSYLLHAANAIWQSQGFNVIGISLSGIAAKGLEDSSHIPSSTIASFKLKLNSGHLPLNKKSILVMDEAGMTNLNDMATIVDTVKRFGAKLVLIGDPEQLQPIGPGAPFRALTEQIGFVELNDIRRQHDPDDREASKQCALGNIEVALAHYEHKGALLWHDTPLDAMQTLINHWQQDISHAHDLNNRIILAHRNADTSQLNQLARHTFIDKGLISTECQLIDITRQVPSPDGFHIHTERETKPFAIGDRILFRRNDKSLKVVNGDFATIRNINNKELTVVLANQRELTFNTQSYTDFDYGYAATVHKAQGGTFDKVYVYAGGHGWNRHLAYVALTRHRQDVELHVDRETYRDKLTFTKQLKQQDIKDSVLNWPLNYAIRLVVLR